MAWPVFIFCDFYRLRLLPQTQGISFLSDKDHQEGLPRLAKGLAGAWDLWPMLPTTPLKMRRAKLSEG